MAGPTARYTATAKSESGDFITGAANALSLPPPLEYSDMAGTRCWVDPIANDPERASP
jgi:hypothetical protein